MTSPTSTTTEPKAKRGASAKQSEKRRATELKLLQAFETLLAKGGLDTIGINAIVEEAGVGKGLIYDYFGGLPGLVEAWVKQSDLAPSAQQIIGEQLPAFLGKSQAQQIAQVHDHYATMLRKSALVSQAMAEELRTPGDLSDPLALLRQKIGASHEKIFTELSPLTNEDELALCMIFHAAANYLALRAQTSPNFNGIDLSTQDGWATAMSFFRRIADRLSA